MSIPLTFNYNDEADYDFPATIDVASEKAQLALLQDNVDFTEDFADDTGSIYDSNKSEFIGGLNRQVLQVPLNSTCGANFNSSINLEGWSNGIQTGTSFNGADILGGKLDITNTKYVQYDADKNADSQQQGCIKVNFSTNYNGYPSVNRCLFSVLSGSGTENVIHFYHYSTGEIYIYIYSSTATPIVGDSFGLWSADSSLEYEFELNFDITNGETRLFINGSQFGSTQTGTGVRDSNINNFRLGANYNAATLGDYFINDFLIFDTVQHTSNYTPGFSVSAYKYLETSVVLPEMEHTGDGSILAFNLLSLTYTGSPRILLDIDRSGDDLYWNVDTWDVSDGSYDQATDLTTFNAHCDILDVIGGKYGQFKIVYPNSNTISAVNDLTANMLVNIGYSTANPLIKPKLTTKIDGVEDWEEVVEKTGSDDVKAICELNGVDYYYNGSAWAESSGYSQSNSVAEILANKSSLLIEGYGKNFRIGRYLHSADGTTTPKLDTDTLSVNFSGISPTIKEIFIYGNLRDIIEGLDAVTIYYRWPWSVGGKVVLTDDYQEYETFPEGYFEISIKHENGHPPPYFEFKIKTKLFRFEYPSDELLAEGDYIKIGDLTLLFTKRIVSF